MSFLVLSELSVVESMLLFLINLSEFFGEMKRYIYGYRNALMPLTLLHRLRNGRSPDLVRHGPLNPQLKGLLTKQLLLPVMVH